MKNCRLLFICVSALVLGACGPSLSASGVADEVVPVLEDYADRLGVNTG